MQSNNTGNLEPQSTFRCRALSVPFVINRQICLGSATNISYHAIQIQYSGNHKYITSITNIFRAPTLSPHTNRGPQMRFFVAKNANWGFEIHAPARSQYKPSKHKSGWHSSISCLWLTQVKSSGGSRGPQGAPGGLNPTTWLLLGCEGKFGGWQWCGEAERMPGEHLHNFMRWTWAGFRPVTFCFAPLLLSTTLPGTPVPSTSASITWHNGTRPLQWLAHPGQCSW